jgi:hypothetical protein
MFKKSQEQLNETASAWIRGLPDYFKNVLAKLKDQKERSLKVAEVMQKAKQSTNDATERKEVLSLINKLRDELPPITSNITEGEDTMSSKKTNLDMFLEGVESVEVAKKPKFHSIHRLYEARDEDYKKDDEEEVDENIEHNPAAADQGGVVEEDDDEDKEHEDAESDEDEADEKEAGDDDEAGGEDEEPETDSDEGEEEGEKKDSEEDGEEDEENLDEGLEGVLKALGSDPITGAGELIDMLISKVNQVVAGAKDKADAQAKVKTALEQMKQAAAARKDARGAVAKSAATAKNVPGASKMENTDEMDEGSQGYAAGLKGVRKDAGAKGLKSGTNKVPTPKVAITGDKKLLKKPTTLKGDSYPKSSVAGAARPGAPKVKKS